MYDKARTERPHEPPGSRPGVGLPIAPGDLIAGKLEVERVLGTGGCGVVVAALHRELGERVAVKLLQRSAMRSPETVERFAREARAAARIRSEHVARVHDFGTTESGVPYMVMECLDGEDLGATLAREGRVAIEAAVDYVLMACDAVAEAHALGIIHRDLKPANLFLTARVDGRPIVKVLDFGISKLLTAEGAEKAQSMTQTQAVMGSPLYMSPEQMEASRDVDARADVWALGSILYQLIGGATPFEAPTVPLLYVRVLSGERPTPLETRRPEVPIAIARAVDRCLARDPAERFPTVGHLAMALAPFASADVSALAERIARLARAEEPSGPTSGIRRVPSLRSASAQAAAPPVGAVAPVGPVAPPRRLRLATAFAAIAVLAGVLGAAGALASVASPPAATALRGASRVAAASALAFRAARADLAFAGAVSMRDAPPPAASSAAPPAAPIASAAEPAASPRGAGEPRRPQRPPTAAPTDVLDER